MNSNIGFLKQCSCLWELGKKHIKSQAKLVNKFCLGGSKGGEISWDQKYSQKYITKISSEQIINLNIKKKKYFCKKFNGNLKEKKNCQQTTG